MTAGASGIEQEYLKRLSDRQAVLASRERHHMMLGRASLGVVLIGLVLIWLLRWAALPWLGLVAAAVAILAIVHTRLLNARDRARSAVAFYERGLRRLRHEWIGHGETGERFRPDGHLYADDLDLFGRGSLFELLATARTQAGEEVLASWLLSPATPEEVVARQEAIRELVPRLDLREAMAVAGDGLPRAGVDPDALRAWAASPPILRNPWPRVAMAVLSAIAAGLLIALAIAGDLPPTLARILFGILLVQSAFVIAMRSRVERTNHAVGSRAHDLELFGGLLRILEHEPFESPRLKSLAAALVRSHRPASTEIRTLDQLVALLNSRANIFVAIPAALMFWGTQMAMAIDAWRTRLSADIPRWLDVVGELDALLALAAFSAEHPQYPFPTFVTGVAHVHADGLAHPLLPDSAVANDVALGADAPRLLVVSGSNMSGKSTLLRAIGLNVVLAQTGAPVRATRFVLSPLSVGASIRVLDSLMEGTSRFFAEITRLKNVVDLVDRREGHVLFLLDEILSGTNSHDRRAGAEALLRGLQQREAIGLVTTHDLALGEIATRMAPLAANVHFEDRFQAGEMTFDYRLRPGIVQTSNAIELMRSIGLDV